MSSRKKPGARVKKRPYTKPEIKQVQLRPEEAVLGGCKQSAGASPGQTMSVCSACAGVYAS